MDGQPPKASKELEKLMRQTLLASAQSNGEVSNGLLRWTIGSMLVVNGGALVALLGADDLRTEAFKEAALLFGGGMFAALVGGLLWAAAVGSLSLDGFRRAFNPEPITMNDLLDLKKEKRTRHSLTAATASLFLSLGLFGMGCISTAYVPEHAELDRLSAESAEATARFVAEANGLLEIFKSKESTPEQRQAALDRVRAAEIEAKIRRARVKRALGQPDDLIPTESNSATPPPTR